MTGQKRALFLASFLMLFVELALIRGTVATVVYLSFFTNLVLLASFLGIGLGFLRARGDRDHLAWAPVLLVGLMAFLLLFPVKIGPAMDRVPQLLGLGHVRALPEWVSVPVIFLGVVAVMAAIAERVGRLFSAFAPLEAYRLDVLGSIAGIVAFSASVVRGRGAARVDRGDRRRVRGAPAERAVPVRGYQPGRLDRARGADLAGPARRLVSLPTRDVCGRPRTAGWRSG